MFYISLLSLANESKIIINITLKLEAKTRAYRSERQLRSQGPLSAHLHVADESNMVAAGDLPFIRIIIDDQSVGAIRLFPIIDWEISTDSHH